MEAREVVTQLKLKAKSLVADGARVAARSVPVQKQASAAELDPVIHERMRLGIISALAVREALTFSELKRLLEATDGNLSVHARKLEEAEYIVCTKSFNGRVPRTEYRITSSGRKALEYYLDQMEQIIRQTRGD
jgi:DNA-binding HxlR family transcriptional regulator